MTEFGGTLVWKTMLNRDPRSETVTGLEGGRPARVGVFALYPSLSTSMRHGSTHDVTSPVLLEGVGVSPDLFRFCPQRRTW